MGAPTPPPGEPAAPGGRLPSLVGGGLPAGARLGPYEVQGVLGKGGMGVVLRARDHALGRDVALKVMPAADDADRRRRALRELEAAARVRHPGVVQVHGAGEGPGYLYLVLELVRGEGLDRHLARGGPLEPARAVALVGAVAEAVVALHAAGVVHRDLKPGNVLLDERGTPRLTDFGVARLLDPDAARLTRTQDIVGSPLYAAPEQLAGGSVGPLADVYALGGLLHECLTGVAPFAHAEGLVGLAVAKSEQAPAPSALRPGVPAHLDRLCRAALAPDPADRPASAAHFLGALRGDAPGGAARAGRRKALAIAVLVACVVAAGLAALTQGRRGPGLEGAGGAGPAPAPPADAPAALAGVEAALSRALALERAAVEGPPAEARATLARAAAAAREAAGLAGATLASARSAPLDGSSRAALLAALEVDARLAAAVGAAPQPRPAGLGPDAGSALTARLERAAAGGRARGRAALAREAALAVAAGDLRAARLALVDARALAGPPARARDLPGAATGAPTGAAGLVDVPGDAPPPAGAPGGHGAVEASRGRDAPHGAEAPGAATAALDALDREAERALVLALVDACARGVGAGPPRLDALDALAAAAEAGLDVPTLAGWRALDAVDRLLDGARADDASWRPPALGLLLALAAADVPLLQPHLALLQRLAPDDPAPFVALMREVREVRSGAPLLHDRIERARARARADEHLGPRQRAQALLNLPAPRAAGPPPLEDPTAAEALALDPDSLPARRRRLDELLQRGARGAPLERARLEAARDDLARAFEDLMASGGAAWSAVRKDLVNAAAALLAADVALGGDVAALGPAWATRLERAGVPAESPWLQLERACELGQAVARSWTFGAPGAPGGGGPGRD